VLAHSSAETHYSINYQRRELASTPSVETSRSFRSMYQSILDIPRIPTTLAYYLSPQPILDLLKRDSCLHVAYTIIFACRSIF
jgi:hypothetical protein